MREKKRKNRNELIQFPFFPIVVIDYITETILSNLSKVSKINYKPNNKKNLLIVHPMFFLILII